MTDNKLIAEFIGHKPKSILGHGSVYNDYSKSWDWLMPVVEKIDLILPDDNLVTISFNRCLIEWHEKGITFEGLGNTRIEATYKAVVEFIKQYNQNK